MQKVALKMAYGVNATVEANIGGFTQVMTTARVDIWITTADAIVDRYNSSAAAANKTQASNMMATDLAQNAQSAHDAKGSQSKSANQGEPAYQLKIRKVPSPEALALIRPAISSRNDTQIGS